MHCSTFRSERKAHIGVTSSYMCIYQMYSCKLMSTTLWSPTDSGRRQGLVRVIAWVVQLCVSSNNLAPYISGYNAWQVQHNDSSTWFWAKVLPPARQHIDLYPCKGCLADRHLCFISVLLGNPCKKIKKPHMVDVTCPITRCAGSLWSLTSTCWKHLSTSMRQVYAILACLETLLRYHLLRFRRFLSEPHGMPRNVITCIEAVFVTTLAWGVSRHVL